MTVCVPRFSWRCCSKKNQQQQTKPPQNPKKHYTKTTGVLLASTYDGKSAAWVFPPLEREKEGLDYSLPLKHEYLMQAWFCFTVSLRVFFWCLVQERALCHSCSNCVRPFSSHRWQPAYLAYLALPWAVVVRNHSSHHKENNIKYAARILCRRHLFLCVPIYKQQLQNEAFFGQQSKMTACASFLASI